MLRGGIAPRPWATRAYKNFIATRYGFPGRSGKSGKHARLFAANLTHPPTCGDSNVEKESRFARDASISPLHNNGQIVWCAAWIKAWYPHGDSAGADV
jgi:hypothetical protein